MSRRVTIPFHVSSQAATDKSGLNTLIKKYFAPGGLMHASLDLLLAATSPSKATICSLLRCALRAPRKVGRLQRHSSERRLAAESTLASSPPTTQG
eukprot:COSAG01_NODE_2263_length_8048_cov_23.261165_2_plen_96_part_00